MEKENRRRICPGCGKDLPEELHFCLYCMTRLSEDETEAVVTTKRRKVNPVIVGFIGCVLIGIGSFALSDRADLSAEASALCWKNAGITELAGIDKLVGDLLQDDNTTVTAGAQVGAVNGDDIVDAVEEPLEENVSDESTSSPEEPANSSGENVPSDNSDSNEPWQADITQLTEILVRETHKKFPDVTIVTSYEEYQNSPLPKITTEEWPLGVIACRDNFSGVGIDLSETEYMEQQARLFVSNISGLWGYYEEDPQIIAILFDYYEDMDSDGDGVYDCRDIWMKVYF